MGAPKEEGILPRLRIERMAYGADAIAHDDGGRVVFVSGGVPGDVVDVRVTQEKGRFAHGTVESVVEASPLRVDVPKVDFQKAAQKHKTDNQNQIGRAHV